MDRWSGIFKVPLYPNGGSSSYYRVAASLRLSPSTKTLAVPSANAIFFTGDRVEGTGNPVIEALSDLEKIAETLVSKFGGYINAWVVEASTFSGPFAVYKDFIPSINEYGEPKSYKADGFPASTSTVLLLFKCLKEAKHIISGKQKELYQAEISTTCSLKPKTVLLGFSKGGTVLNQVVTELAYSPVQGSKNLPKANKAATGGGLATQEDDQIIPSSKEILLSSIAEIHYVDVGLNSDGAYLTNQDVIDKLSEHLKQRDLGIRFFLHGTPRQWRDSRRIWILKEKDRLVELLKGAAHKNMGKLLIRERLYFGNKTPDLQMHFEIIEKLDVT